MNVVGKEKLGSLEVTGALVKLFRGDKAGEK